MYIVRFLSQIGVRNIPPTTVFLVGAFPVKSARLLQWLVFLSFRQTTDLCMYNFLCTVLSTRF